jgi:hypothetical protein
MKRDAPDHKREASTVSSDQPMQCERSQAANHPSKITSSSSSFGPRCVAAEWLAGSEASCAPHNKSINTKPISGPGQSTKHDLMLIHPPNQRTNGEVSHCPPRQVTCHEPAANGDAGGIASVGITVATPKEHPAEDEHDLFGKLVAHLMRELPPGEATDLCRIRIQQTIVEAKYASRRMFRTDAGIDSDVTVRSQSPRYQ